MRSGSTLELDIHVVKRFLRNRTFVLPDAYNANEICTFLYPNKLRSL